MFEAIRKARPSRLLLYQDGPRNANDVPRMEACRQIVENIDWECQVHRNYQTVNRGCDPSNYLSHQWAFSLYDKCVVFEDDDIPSETFLPFCKEMLDRYEHDDRVGMIQGFNLEERTPDAGAEADYFSAPISAFGVGPRGAEWCSSGTNITIGSTTLQPCSASKPSPTNAACAPTSFP